MSMGVGAWCLVLLLLQLLPLLWLLLLLVLLVLLLVLQLVLLLLLLLPLLPLQLVLLLPLPLVRLPVSFLSGETAPSPTFLGRVGRREKKQIPTTTNEAEDRHGRVGSITYRVYSALPFPHISN